MAAAGYRERRVGQVAKAGRSDRAAVRQRACKFLTSSGFPHSGQIRCMTDLHRCAWAEGDPLRRAYHDEEWGVPQRDPRMLWEMLMLEGFQAGLAWIIILRKREGFRKEVA